MLLARENKPIETLRGMGDTAPLLYLIVSGGGAGFQNDIWEVPGVSNFFIGAQMPYDMEETIKVLGFKPTKFVSEETAIDLALTAYLKAWKPGKQAIGVGVTCSVTTNRNRRGDNEIFVAVFTDAACHTISTTIPKGEFWNEWKDGKLTKEQLDGCVSSYRISEGGLANHLAAYLLTTIVGGPCRDPKQGLKTNFHAMDLARARILAHPYFKANGQRGTLEDINSKCSVIYPGAFNPPHPGHFQGSEAAMKQSYFNTVLEAQSRPESITVSNLSFRELIFSTTVNPVHKPALTAAEMLQRASMMKGYNFLLTEDDPLYLDKARKFPGAHFIMGADALKRTLDPNWGVNSLDLARELIALESKFLVLGRLVDDKYQTCDSVLEEHIDTLYRADYNQDAIEHDQLLSLVTIPVDFRLDISSSELRAKEQT
jgi:nicotinic acid mononucleotide adenylyltransferase/nicotinamide mononucleotide (NMN) deamidase PncC